MSATALKSTNRRFSSLNCQNFEFFCLVPGSPTHTGLICEKTLKPNISSLGPFKSNKPLKTARTFSSLVILMRVKGNLKEKMYLYVNSTNQRCPKKLSKTFLIENFFHLPHWWCTLSCAYLCEFSKKFETA